MHSVGLTFTDLKKVYSHCIINIIFLKVLQEVKALQEMNCVSIAAGEDHTVVVTDQ